MDYSGSWRVLCLSVLSIEDSEDVYIFCLILMSIMVTCGGFLYIRRIFVRAVETIFRTRVLEKIDGLASAGSSQSAAIAGISGQLNEMKIRLEIPPV